MTVRAKFSCIQIEDEYGGSSVVFEPVRSGSEENREFFKYTPSGSIKLGVIGSSVSRQFQVGRDYYVDFTAAPEPE